MTTNIIPEVDERRSSYTEFQAVSGFPPHADGKWHFAERSVETALTGDLTRPMG